MTNQQEKFFEIIEQLKFTKNYWDKNKPEIHFEKIKNDLPTLSSGEASMLKFLAGIWLGHNELNFDYISDASNFDGKSLEIYKNWTLNPFFP